MTFLAPQWDINVRLQSACNLPSLSQVVNLSLVTLFSSDGSPHKSLCAFLEFLTLSAAFSKRIRSCLHLWNNDRSMTDALEVAKMFLPPVDTLTAMFPCQGGLNGLWTVDSP